MLRHLTVLALLTTLTFPLAARAQEQEPTAYLQAVDASGFPDISARLVVSDSTGRGVSGMGPDVISLTEDGTPVTGLMVAEEEVGVQVVFALNITPVFQSRDVLGNSRLDYVKQALLLWAGEWGRLDDVTVLTLEGAQVQHTSSPAEFRQALEAYTPEYDAGESGFQLLQQALSFAADPMPRPGMRRVVVLITSLLPSVNDVPVSDAASRANEMHVPIHTFLAGPVGVESQPGADNVVRLAELTGAVYSYFGAPETLLPVYELIASQRTNYVLSYRSTLATSGRHQLSAVVDADGLAAVTPPAEFALTVEPPAVTFISPPSTLTRKSSNPTLDAARLQPTDQDLQVVIEFPDGHPRAITRSQLYVDGVLVGENRQAPFDQFTWNLTGYESADTHRLRVAVLDELGLEGVTIEQPVKVDVLVERSAIKRVEPFIRPLAILAGILLAGVLLAVLVTVSLRRPRPREVVRARLKLPVISRSKPVRPRRGKAYLEVAAGEGEHPGSRIELVGTLITLGRDPAQVQIVFADRSVSRRHARIVEDQEGVFQLHDEGSTSGTWLNLEQVPATGVQLNHGDRINLGRVQLVFRLRAAALEDTPSPRPISTADTSPRRIPPRPRSGSAPDDEDTLRLPPRPDF